MTLLERLAALPQGRPPLSGRTAAGDWSLDVAAIARRAQALRGWASGRRIGLRPPDPAQTLVALAVFDGAAEAIALISPDAPVDTVLTLCAQAGLDGLICADLDALPGMIETRGFDAAETAYAPDATATRSATDGATQWIMTTSGATGTPKLVSHRLEGLVRTVMSPVPEADAPRWGIVYDSTRFAGLQGLLQAGLSGALLVAPDFDAPLKGKLDQFRDFGVTHLSTMPTLWRKILMSPARKEQALRQITMGGEIADERILQALKAHYPQASIIHIFGSTEAGVALSIVDGRAGFPQSYPDAPGWRVVAPRRWQASGAESLRRSRLCRCGRRAGGRRSLGRHRRCRLYRGRPGPFLSRASGVINVGGDKIHPERIKRMLLSHPLVPAARVHGTPNPITGAVAAAEVALAEPADEAGQREAVVTLRRYLAEHPERRMVPAALRIVPHLALNAAGKINRS